MPRLRKKKTGVELDEELLARDMAARRERGDPVPEVMDAAYFQNLRKVYSTPSRASSTSRGSGSGSISRIPAGVVDVQARRTERIKEEMKAQVNENSRKVKEEQARIADEDFKARYAVMKAAQEEAAERYRKAEEALREDWERVERLGGKPMFVLETDGDGDVEEMEPLPQGAFADLDGKEEEVLSARSFGDDFEEGEIRQHEGSATSSLPPPTPRMASSATLPRMTKRTPDLSQAKTIDDIAAAYQAKKPAKKVEEEPEKPMTEDPNIIHYADLYERSLYGMFDVAHTPLLPPYPIASRDTAQLNAACLEHDIGSRRSQDNASSAIYLTIIGPDTDISMIEEPQLFFRVQDMKRQQQLHTFRKYQEVSALLEFDQLNGRIDPEQDVLAGDIVSGMTGAVSYMSTFGQCYGEHLRTEYEEEEKAKETAKQQQFGDWLADQRIDIDKLSIEDIRKRCRSSDSLKTVYHTSEADHIPLSAYRSLHPALRPAASQFELEEDFGGVELYEGT